LSQNNYLGISTMGYLVWLTKDSIDQKFVDQFNVKKLKSANNSSWW
jgi:hypothetical protein